MHPSVSLVADAIQVPPPGLGVVLERLIAVVTEVTFRHPSVIGFGNLKNWNILKQEGSGIEPRKTRKVS